MDAIRVKAKTAFPFSDDGIHGETLVAGQVVHARAHLVPGLLAEGLVEETTEGLTTPERLAELRAAHADPHAEAGVTPWQGVRAGKQEPTVVEEEHLEPVRRRAKERAAAGKGAAAVARPGSPPPVDDRRTPPHPPGTVVDADDRAAQVTGKTVDEVLVGDVGGEYATKDEHPTGRKRARGA